MNYELLTLLIGVCGVLIALFKIFREILNGIGEMQKDLRTRIDNIFHNLDSSMDKLKERITVIETTLDIKVNSKL